MNDAGLINFLLASTILNAVLTSSVYFERILIRVSSFSTVNVSDSKVSRAKPNFKVGDFTLKLLRVVI
jgi:hypothetical protein